MGAAIGFVVGGLAGGDAQRSQRNKARDAYNAGAKDRDVMVQSSDEPARIVYGRQRVSGPIAFAHSSGSKGERLDLVVLLAPHEIDAVETVWFDDQPLTMDAFGSVTNTELSKAVIVQASQTFTASSTATLAHAPVRILAVTATWHSGDLGREMSSGVEYTWTSGVSISFGSAPAAAEGGAIITVAYEWEQSRTAYAFVRPQLGTATQAADNPLLTAAAGKWTSAHRLRGIAYLAVTLIYDQDVWGGGGIPNVAATVRGHKIRDPRTGLTAWTDNAALVVAHYVSHYLPGVQASEVPDAELSVEADCCDELVALDAVGSTQRRYTIDAAISTETAPKDVLATLESAMAGTITDAQGRILIRAGRHLAPAMTITEDYLAGAGPRILPARSRSTLINKVVPIYSEPSKAWAPVQAPAVSNATYLAADGGVELSTELQLDGVISDSLRAQRLAKIMLERERAALEVTITCNLRAYDLTIGDTVALTLSRYGWSAKLFVVLERSVDLAACTIALRLQETSAAVWDWAYGQATKLDLTPNTSLPSAWARPDVLTGLTAASGTAHLLRLADGSLQCRAWVSWSQSTTATVTQGGRIRVRWRRVDSTVWVEETQQPGDSVGCYIGPLAEQVPVIIAVQPVTVLGRESVSWTAVSHIPAGKAEPPGNVAGIVAEMVLGAVSISWDPAPDIDYASTEIRVGSSWAGGSPLSVVSSTQWTWASPPDGMSTVWLKHIDTSGNYSAAAASIIINNAPLSPVAGLSAVIVAGGVKITWMAAQEIGYAATEIRIGSTWAGGALLWSGRANSHIWSGPAQGSYVLMVRHIDVLGHYGAAEAAVSITVPDGIGAATQADVTAVADAAANARQTADQAQADASTALLTAVAVPGIRSSAEKLDAELSRLAAAVIQLTLKTGDMDDVMASAGISVDPTNGKVRIAAVEQAIDSIKQARVDIDAATASIDLKADALTVSAINARLTTAEVDIDGLASAITLKADATTVASQGARLTSAESDINGLTGTVALKADTTTVNGINARLTTAETSISTYGGVASQVTDLSADNWRLAREQDLSGVSSLQALLALWQAEQRINTAIANVHEETTAKINGDIAAEAAYRLQLDAATSAGIATVQAQANATSSTVTGLSSQYALKAQTVRSDGKVVLGSIGLSSTSNDSGSQSEIILAADKLTFVPSSDPNATTQPLLTTGTVNGAPALVLSAARIGDLTIHTVHIAPGAVTSLNEVLVTGYASLLPSASGGSFSANDLTVTPTTTALTLTVQINLSFLDWPPNLLSPGVVYGTLYIYKNGATYKTSMMNPAFVFTRFSTKRAISNNIVTTRITGLTAGVAVTFGAGVEFEYYDSSGSSVSANPRLEGRASIFAVENKV